MVESLSGGERSAGQFGEFFIPPTLLQLLLCHGTLVATHLSKGKSDPNKMWHKRVTLTGSILYVRFLFGDLFCFDC